MRSPMAVAFAHFSEQEIINIVRYQGAEEMKLTFFHNACCVYEAQGFKLLADPWFYPGSFGTWTHDPPITIGIEAVKDADCLYISHIHQDHLQPESLAHFKRDIPIVCLKEPLGLVPRKLRSLGFTEIWEMGNKEQRQVGPFMAQMFGPFTKHPFFGDDCEIGNVIDSSLLIKADGKTILNANDNALTVETAKQFTGIDLLQHNFNNAGAYPACFDNLTDVEKQYEAQTCVERNLSHLLTVSKATGAKQVQPFAGQYKLDYGYEHLNPFLGTCSSQYAVEFLKANLINAVHLDEGETLDLGS